MPFMQQQVTRKMRWIQIDGTCGVTSVPAEDAPEVTRVVGNEAAMRNGASVYYEGTVQSVEIVTGYGARLSAPGYMDCTEWTVFDTAEQAQAYLDEYYPEDDDEEAENAE